jgi:hypothetical protein
MKSKSPLHIWILFGWLLSPILLQAPLAVAQQTAPEMISNFTLAQNTTPDGSVDKDLAEVQHQEALMKANLGILNASNPLYQKAAADLAAANTPTDPNIQVMMKLMNNPMFQGYLKVLSDPELWTDLEKTIKTTNRQSTFIAECCIFVFFIMFRAWGTAKIRNWFIRFIFGLTANIGYICLTFYLIPAILIGDSYEKFVARFYHLISSL